LRCRLFSSRNNLREQSRSHYSDQEFSVSRSNQAHRHSNSLHQRKSDRRIDRFNLHTHETNDSRWSHKIVNQKQIRSVSNRFRNKIRLVTSNRIKSRDRHESTSRESLFQRLHHLFLYNLRSLLSVVFACKRRIRMQIGFFIRKSKKRHLRFSIDFWESWEWKIDRKSCSVWECRNQTIQKHDWNQVTWCD
jgi:hypothetical protein